MTIDATDSTGAALPSVDAIRNVLRQVIDPEVGINIVDLGLVYRIEVAPGRVRIEMTMTSPACPMGEMIMDDVFSVLESELPNTVEPDVCLVWEPPWDESMMSEESKRHFGWE